MYRRFCQVLAIILAVASAYVDASACGDKFVRVGRSARFRRYASVHPSPILLYAPHWTVNGTRDFETMLKRAGHTTATVTTPEALSRALSSAKYELIITDLASAGGTADVLDAIGSTATIVPVIYKPTKYEEAAARQYASYLQPDKITKFEALEQIDRVMEKRSKPTVVPAAR